jgi:hypothetical protein
MNGDVPDVPDYVEARIRQLPPIGVPVVRGSTPVIAFGSARDSNVATLGWNPSKLEFLDRGGNELVKDERRLETLASIGAADLADAPTDAILRVFDACNNYFHRKPYWRWFNKLEKILNCVDASYCDNSACHLDFVQWATDPVWGGLMRFDQTKLIATDLPFLERQLSQERIRLLLLNGTGIVGEYKKRFGADLAETPLGGRLRLFAGRSAQGLNVFGWNINLQTTPGVSNKEIGAIGEAIKQSLTGGAT